MSLCKIIIIRTNYPKISKLMTLKESPVKIKNLKHKGRKSLIRNREFLSQNLNLNQDRIFRKLKQK